MWLYPVPALIALAGWIFLFATTDKQVIAFGVGLRAKLFDDFAVNRYAAGDDQFFGVPPRSDAGKSDEFLQPLLHK